MMLTAALTSRVEPDYNSAKVVKKGILAAMKMKYFVEIKKNYTKSLEHKKKARNFAPSKPQ